MDILHTVEESMEEKTSELPKQPFFSLCCSLSANLMTRGSIVFMFASIDYIRMKMLRYSRFRLFEIFRNRFGDPAAVLVSISLRE